MGVELSICKVSKVKWPRKALEKLDQREQHREFINEVALFEMPKTEQEEFSGFVETFGEKNGVPMAYDEEYPVLAAAGGMRAYAIQSLVLRDILLDLKSEFEKIEALEEEMMRRIRTSRKEGKRHACEDLIRKPSTKEYINWDHPLARKLAGNDLSLLLSWQEEFYEILNGMEDPSYDHRDYEYVLYYH